MIGHDDARRLLSVRRDQPLDPSAAAELDQHLAGCSGCLAFERRLDEVGLALRAPLEPAPDVRARVLAAVAAGAAAAPSLAAVPPTAGAGGRSPAPHGGSDGDGRSGAGDDRVPSVVTARPQRAWRWLPAAACLVVGLLIGSALVGGLREPPVPAAAQVPEQVAAAQFGITSLSTDLEIVERGWNEEVPTRTFTGTLDYETPGSLALHLDDTTRYPSPAWVANDVDLVAHDDRWWARGPRDCSSLGQPSCTAPAPRLEVVDAIAPFDDGAPVPLDLVVPVRSFLRSSEPVALGSRTIDGRDAVGVRVTALQVGPLLDGLRPAGNLRQFHPADVVDLWLDATSWTPLRFEVTATDEPDRLTWARNRGYVEQPGDEILAVAVGDLRVNAGIDDTRLEPPPPGGVRRDAGFTPAVPDATSSSWVAVDPATVPAGLTAATTGVVGAGTAHETAVRTWVGGRGWVKVAATRDWDGDRLFGDLGSPVRRLDADDGSVRYVSLDGTRVALHGEGIDVVITGSVDEPSLLAVAAGLGVHGTVVPDDWSDAATETVESAAEVLPGLLVAPAASGYEAAAVRADGAVVTQAYSGSGGRGFVMVEAAGNRLAPPLDMDVGGVVVRGVDGRFSASRGELEWVEADRIHRLTRTTLTRAVLLAVAAALTSA